MARCDHGLAVLLRLGLMLPRRRADYRTLLWALVLTPGLAIAQYARPGLVVWLLPLGLYFGLCAAIFAHHHNHCPVFPSRTANVWFGAWLSFVSIYPSYAWIPTHNLNHHRFVNRAGDASLTWRRGRSNTWWAASTFAVVAAYWQVGLLWDFVRAARAKNPRVFRQILLEHAVVLGGHGVMAGLAMTLHGVRCGASVYGAVFLLPAAFAFWFNGVINYIQHVHCDPWSKHDHSRNFVSRVENWLLFNSGLHSAHHEHPGTHWSAVPTLHQRIVSEIHPALLQPSILVFVLRSYVAGLFGARYRTVQVGRAAYDPPVGQPVRIRTARIETVVEAGVNAPMA